MRFAVEQWAPEYGGAVDDITSEAVDPEANVERAIEIAEAAWAPRRPDVAQPAVVSFVDGVSRIDAQVWIEEEDGEHRPAVCASYAAGAVRCDGRATVDDIRVQRGLFTASAAASPIKAAMGTYEVRPSAGDLDALGLAVVERMRALEADVARSVADADVIVLDGLLWGRADVRNAIGYVKTHRTPYLPPELNAVVTALRPGQRTPLFLVSTSWTRFSWYLRLPGANGHPWAGIVRCEASPDLSPADAAALADSSAVALPRFASSAHKDPRAPQNLYPIGGLERELRRRLGDRELLYRSLRASAGSPGGTTHLATS